MNTQWATTRIVTTRRTSNTSKNVLLPTTNLGSVEVSRLVIGTNWINGYSHRSAAADKKIKEYNKFDRANAAEILRVFLDAGVNVILGGISPLIYEAAREAQDKSGRKLYIINTPPL